VSGVGGGGGWGGGGVTLAPFLNLLSVKIKGGQNRILKLKKRLTEYI
jgi:hypothetical protein